MVDGWSEDSAVLWNVLVPDASLVSDLLLWHVLDINALLFILLVLLGEARCNLIAVLVDLVNCLIEFVVILFLLFTETVQPNVLVFFIVCDQVRVTVPQVLLPKFHRSL